MQLKKKSAGLRDIPGVAKEPRIGNSRKHNTPMPKEAREENFPKANLVRVKALKDRCLTGSMTVGRGLQNLPTPHLYRKGAWDTLR